MSSNIFNSESELQECISANLKARGIPHFSEYNVVEDAPNSECYSKPGPRADLYVPYFDLAIELKHEMSFHQTASAVGQCMMYKQFSENIEQCLILTSDIDDNIRSDVIDYVDKQDITLCEAESNITECYVDVLCNPKLFITLLSIRDYRMFSGSVSYSDTLPSYTAEF